MPLQTSRPSRLRIIPVAFVCACFVILFLVPLITGLLGHFRTSGLPPTRVTVRFQVDQRTFNDDDAKITLYVHDLAAAFEARLLESRSWPPDIRVTGGSYFCAKRCRDDPVAAYLQIRSTFHFSPDAVRLALGTGIVTLVPLTDTSANPCAPGDTAHLQIVPSAVGASGCLRPDQSPPHFVSDVIMDDLCDPTSPTLVASEPALFTFAGPDARWLEQWATGHRNGELAIMVDGVVVGVVKSNQILADRTTIPLAGFRVQSQIACALTTVVTSGQATPTVLGSDFAVR